MTGEPTQVEWSQYVAQVAWEGAMTASGEGDHLSEQASQLRQQEGKLDVHWY